MKSRFLLPVLVAFALIVAACTGETAETSTTAGGGDDTTTTTATSDGGTTSTAAPMEDDRQNVELDFTIWAAGPTLEAWQGLADGYVDVDPRVSAVNFEFVPFPRYHDVLNVRLSSGAVQNGGWLFVNLAPRYVGAGVLTDMEPVFTDTEGYELDQIVDPAREQWRDGSGAGLYAYPFAQSPMVVFWNKDAFAAAGVTTPQELLDAGDWNYATMQETAKAMQDSGVVDWGFGYQVDFFAEALGWRNLDNFYSAHGGRPWSDDGQTCQFGQPEMVSAFQQVHDMIFVDGSMRGPGEANPSFFAGQAAMAMMHNAAAQAQAEGATFEYGMVPQPAPPPGAGQLAGPAANTSGFVIYEDAPNADIAAQFLAWLTSPENAKVIAQFHSSPRIEILEPSLFTSGLSVTEEEIQRSIIDTLEIAWRGPAHSNWEALDREIQRVIGAQLWVADADVQAVMDEVCNSITELLQG